MSELDEHDGHDGHDRDLVTRMHDASDTLVVDTTLIRVNAVRAGRRRRRMRNGLVVGGAVASVVLVTAMSTQLAGGTGDGPGERPGTPDSQQYVDRPGRSEPPAEIGNVTLRRGPEGTFVAKGGLAPRATADSRVELWAAREGAPLTRRDQFAPRDGLGVFGHRFRLAPGTWDIELRYVHDAAGTVPTGTFATTLTLRGPVSGSTS